MTKKQKLLRLDDETLELLSKFREELFQFNLNVSESDIVALGLKQIDAKGGVLETMRSQREEEKETLEVRGEGFDEGIH